MFLTGRSGPGRAQTAPLAAAADGERHLRLAALRAGWWLGWLSIGAVLAGLALELPVRHPTALLGLTALAALGNGAAMAIPWQRWLTARRGRLLLDLWSAALLVFVSALVVIAGARADLDLLLFLVVPFLATVHRGARRAVWLAAAAASFVTGMVLAPDGLTAGEAVTRAALLAAATMLAVVLEGMVRREAHARARASARAELEHALLAESHHRVKNSLQTVADLLVLGRLQEPDARAFDATGERIRAIAAVHELLADERGRAVKADALLTAVAATAGATARVDADPVELDPACAQRLAIVVNELVANAVRHGAPPIGVELRGPRPTVLCVRDAGVGAEGGPTGIGLTLVRQVAEHGLGGRFTLDRDPAGPTVARVEFPGPEHAHPHR